MACYKDWNRAIIEFYTYNVPKGSPVYLTFNDNALRDIGLSYLSITAEKDITKDFIDAITIQCVHEENGHKEVSLKGLNYIDEELPNGVAFLALMVLAAHKMIREANVHPNNYFVHLRKLLNIPLNNTVSRDGLGGGVEEPLWLAWNSWLEKHSWEPTAQKGDGAMIYLNYTIGQALFRDEDIVFLKGKYLRTLSLPEGLRALDESQLGGWLRRQQFNRAHLRSGFESSDTGRTAVFFDEAYKIYQTLDWDQPIENVGSVADFITTRKLSAGLYRQTSTRGITSYYMMPRVPNQWKAVDIEIQTDNGEYKRLEIFRPSLFKPLWPIDPFGNAAKSFPLKGSSQFEEIVFPAREFWILTRDPDDRYGGALATWKKYPSLLGEEFQFLLLIKGDNDSVLLRQLNRFKESGLIQWDGEPIVRKGFLEYNGCMILSSAWDGIIPDEDASELYEALKPVAKASVILSSGLKVPNQNAWIEKYPPTLTVYGFEKDFTLRISCGNVEIQQTEIEAQKPQILKECESSGTYRLEVLWNNQVLASITLRIIPWDEVEPNNFETSRWSDIGSAIISGGQIRAKEDSHG